MHFRLCILLILTLAASGACTVRTDSPEEETSFLSEDGLVMVPTDLSLSVNGLQGPATKADYLSVTELISTQAEPRFFQSKVQCSSRMMYPMRSSAAEN